MGGSLKMLQMHMFAEGSATFMLALLGNPSAVHRQQAMSAGQLRLLSSA